MTVGSENAKAVKRGAERKPKWSFGSVHYWPSKLKARRRPTVHNVNKKATFEFSRKEHGTLFWVLAALIILTPSLIIACLTANNLLEFIGRWFGCTVTFLFVLSWPCLIFVMLRRLIKKRPPAQYRSKNSKL